MTQALFERSRARPDPKTPSWILMNTIFDDVIRGHFMTTYFMTYHLEDTSWLWHEVLSVPQVRPILLVWPTFTSCGIGMAPCMGPMSPVRAYSVGAGLCPEKLVKLKKNNNYINWYTQVILVATFVNLPLDIYHILNDSSLNNCHNKLLEHHTFPV